MKIKTTVLGIGLAALTATQAYAAAVELTAAHVNPPGEPTNIGLSTLAGMINASGLDMTMKVFPQGQVGDEKDAIEQVIQGAITMTSVAAAHLGSFVPDVSVFDIPFMFRDAERHPWVVADGPIGKDIADRVRKKINIDLVAYWGAGMRHLFTNGKQIRTPADIEGVKVRVMANQLYIDLFNGLGAKPTPMPYGELYQSLATKLVDAGENDSSGYRGMKFYEPAPILSLTGHTFLYKTVIANPAHLAKMNELQRDYFNKALRWATCYERYLFATNFEGDIEWLKKNAKVTVVESDRAAFQKKLQPVIDKYAEKYGKELVKKIMDAPSDGPTLCSSMIK
jgi:tripartite ATP-independent transporter DctP family solute receptor